MVNKLHRSSRLKLKEYSLAGHSVRGHAASKAKIAGLTIAQAMKAAGWRRKTTFRKHYYVPKYVPQLRQEVLKVPGV